MMTPEELKNKVNEKYSEIARKGSLQPQGCGCSCDCSQDEISVIMNESYEKLEGYMEEADLQLGCGLPTQFAHIRPGDTVVDLGSGAGNDCFIARAEAGAGGKIIGIDFSIDMVERARENASKLGYDNLTFIHGDIERMPLPDEVADVVISNCVINLVPDKQQVYSEVFRILKSGGHFSISDVVAEGNIPPDLARASELYTGCIAGALDRTAYLAIIEGSGFMDIEVQKMTPVEIPHGLLARYLDPEAFDAYKDAGTGFFSVTIFGRKPISV